MKKIIQIILLTVPFVAFAVTTDELVQIHALTTVERAALSTPITDGTLVYDSTIKKLYVYANTTWKELVFAPKVLEKTADYTLTLADNGAILTFNSLTAVTLTIPAGFPVGYNVSVYQTGIGKVTVASDGTTTVRNRLSRFRTAGKDAGIGIVSTSVDVYHLTGDLRR
jgi:hypothetical protein